MYFTSGSDRAFESLMQGKPGFDHYDSGDAGAPEDCGDCRFYRPDWKYQFCVYAECPYQPGKLTAYDAVLFQVKGVDDEMAVFRVEKNRGYTVMSNHHLRNKDLSLKAKGLLSQMLSLPENWDYTLKGLGGGAALYFFKFKKPKADTKGNDDLDEYDFGEDEDDDEDEPAPEVEDDTDEVEARPLDDYLLDEDEPKKEDEV